MPNQPEQKIVIAKGPYSCEVIPGSVVATPGSILIFKANASLRGPIEITLDSKICKDKIRIDAVGAASVTIPPDIPDGVYPYKVYCQQTESLARGGSDPEIIIDT